MMMKSRLYLHGSMQFLPPGTILTPRPDYEENWGSTDFYWVLERHRPDNCIAHKNAVFLCLDEEDIDLCGGGTEWLFIVQVDCEPSRHDLNWSSEISCLISDGYDIDSEPVVTAAKNYWSGVPHYNESVWEYLAPSALINKVVPFDDEAHSEIASLEAPRRSIRPRLG